MNDSVHFLRRAPRGPFLWLCNMLRVRTAGRLLSGGTFQRWRTRVCCLGLWTAPVLWAATASAASYSDDFSGGINPVYWGVWSNEARYSMTVTNNELRFARAQGGNYDLNGIYADFLWEAHGNFEARVEFRNASITRLDGTPGNQIQLNSWFGSQGFCVVRSDETSLSQNAHVWVDPPGALYGTRNWTLTNGVMRITRTNNHLRAYIDTTLLYEANYNTEPAAFNFCLQNNRTRDPISVIYDNFSIAAEGLEPRWPQITSPTNATATAGWYFAYQITATHSPVGYGASGLPGGLSVNAASGLISGTPSTSGLFVVTVMATNEVGVGATNLWLTVNPNRPVEWPTGQGGNGHWYKAMMVAPNGIDWATASNAAVNAGGHLATITAAAENAFVFELITNVYFWYVDGYSNGAGPWLGGFQPPGSVEPGSNWCWVTGEPWGYAHWGLGEPDNVGGNQDRLSFFGYQTHVDSVWDDRNSTTLEQGYVIEYETPPFPPQITSPLSATGRTGQYFAYQITATCNPTDYGASGLPAGLGVNPVNGLISGAASNVGTFVVTLRATNFFGMGTTNLLLTVNPDPAVPWPISQGGNGNSYRAILVGPDGITWPAAAAAAGQSGGHLATITTAAENQFVYGLLTNRDLWFPDGQGNGVGPWLGGWQPSGSPEPAGNWQWRTGEPWGYANWGHGQPDNAPPGQDRLCYFGWQQLRDATWDDRESLARLRGYVVEWESPVKLDIRLKQPKTPGSAQGVSQGAFVAVSWLTNNPGFLLEAARELLASNIVWEWVSAAPGLDSNRFVLTNGVAQERRFYRLRLGESLAGLTVQFRPDFVGLEFLVKCIEFGFTQKGLDEGTGFYAYSAIKSNKAILMTTKTDPGTALGSRDFYELDFSDPRNGRFRDTFVRADGFSGVMVGSFSLESSP